jgi:NCS1 family nucleobase:cation symporter-1
MLLVVIPLLPGMIAKIASGSIQINVGLQHLFSFNWLYGFCLSVVAYWALNVVAPEKSTLIADVVHGVPTVLEGVEADVKDNGTGQVDGKSEHAKTAKEARSKEYCV